MAYPQKPITITASATLDPDTHGMTITKLSAAAGLTVTLPDATGSGMVYDIYVATTVTSNDYIIQVPDADNVIQGAVTISTDIAGVSVPTGTTSDTITMNGSTTGGIIGSNLRLVDVAADTWQVSGHLISSGTEATPFSAAVS